MQLDKQHVLILTVAAVLLGVVLYFAVKYSNPILTTMAVAACGAFFNTIWALFKMSPSTPTSSTSVTITEKTTGATEPAPPPVP